MILSARQAAHQLVPDARRVPLDRLAICVRAHISEPMAIPADQIARMLLGTSTDVVAASCLTYNRPTIRLEDLIEDRERNRELR